MLAVAIINYRTAQATITCVQTLLAVLRNDCCIRVLDNGSEPADVELLRSFADAHADIVELIVSPRNLGFAGGCNRLIAAILADKRVEAILLLNSDTRTDRDFITPMREQLNLEARIDMVAGRMLRESADDVDSLGITLFRSTLASNRKEESELLLGPSGGCALLTRRLLEDLFSTHCEWFDETFFCYAEDTDFVVRARWLGYRAAYAHDATLLHAGSLSSGGPENDFVLYHGIRNSIWWLVKNAPLGWFLRSLPWFIVLHLAIWIRHLRRGKARVLCRLYRDAIKGIPAMRRKRAIIKKTRRIPVSEFSSWVEPHFYQRDYTRRAWKELFKPAPKR